MTADDEYDFDDFPEEDENLPPLEHTEGAILHADGTATLIRLRPDVETVAAILGGWALGSSPAESGVCFWGRPDPKAGLIVPFTDPLGHGEPNVMAQRVFRHLSGQEQDIRGTVLVANDRADTAASKRMDAAVTEYATSVTSLRNRTPHAAFDDEWMDDEG